MTTAKKTIAKRIRWLWWSKWSGVTLCVLLFALWLASGWNFMRFLWYSERWAYVIDVHNGGCLVAIPSAAVKAWADDDQSGLSIEGRVFGWDWKYFHFEKYGSGAQWIGFPLWLPFLLIALPTGFLFWSDHRRRMHGGVGCCAKCGYSLTGNTSGKCPECGAETPAARAAT